MNETNRRRMAWLAGLLSFFVMPGLGQLYNGESKKGMIYFALYFLSPILLALSIALTDFRYLVLLGGFIGFPLIAFRIFVAVEAVLTARMRQDNIPRKSNRWYSYL